MTVMSCSVSSANAFVLSSSVSVMRLSVFVVIVYCSDLYCKCRVRLPTHQNIDCI